MSRLTKEAVRDALLDRAEDLFRDLLGEPQRPGASDWRTRAAPETSMAMRGEKRGQWLTFATGDRGDLLDLVAVHLCGLSRAADNFPAVLDAAARWAGISSGEVDLGELERRREDRRRKAAAEDAKEAARKAETVAGILARVKPIEGSPAAAYLASRGITSWPEGALAYLPGEPAALVVWAKDETGQIVGGQRIFVTGAGARAVGPDGAKLPKMGFGSTAGFPARLDGPLGGDRVFVAEGPETALSVWAATGAEVWAVFGWTGFKAAPVPLDRPVIFCPDRDPPGPAADGFKAAVVHHLDLGADVAVAVAPEPEGSKADLNDTHRRAGLEAVRDALEAAVKVVRPAPAPVASVGPVLRPAEGLEDVLEVGEARRRLRAEVRAGLHRPGVTLIEATLGLGKTHATIAEVVDRLAEAKEAGIEKPAAVITAPMHRLGRQLLADIKAAAPGVPVVQLYGAEAQDPDDPSQTVCKRLDEYRERAALLLDMGSFCDACPFAGSCLHIAGKDQEAEIYVASHERLKASRSPLKKGQKLVATVIDESPMGALVNTSRRAVPLAALMAAPVRIRTKEGEMKRLEAEADLRAFRERLADTIAAHGPGYLRLSDLSGWTVADAEAAAALEWMRKVEDETDPEVRGNKTIPILSGIYAEIARSIAGQIEDNGRLQIRDGEMGLECILSGLKPVSEAFRKAPVLMLDATAEPEIAELLAGGKLAHRAEVRARENVVIEQDPNWSGAKTKFFDWDKTKAAAVPNGNVARVRRFAEWQAMQADTVVIGNKDTIEALSLPAHIKTAHFNALRGLNDFAGADVAVIVGRTLPNSAALARLVGAIWGTPCAGDIQTDGTAWRMVTHGGQIMEAETKAATHEDPRAETVLRLIRDAEVAQAIGRLRAVNRDKPARCILLSDAVVSYPVKLAEMRKTLWACGIIGEMLERGAAFLSPAHAAAAYPDLYASKQAAAKVFGGIDDWATFSIRGLYGKSCPVVTLRRPRASEDGLALVPPSVDDIAAMIESRLTGAKVLRIEEPESRRQMPEAKPEPVADHVPEPIEEAAALPSGFRSVGALVAGLVHKAADAFVGEQETQATLRQKALSIIRDLSAAREAKADAAVSAAFDRAEALAVVIRNARQRPPDAPPGGSRGGAVPQPVIVEAVAKPLPVLIWALEENPKPISLPMMLRRYAVSDAGVRVIWDQAAHIIAETQAEASRAAIRAHIGAYHAMTEHDPEAWA